MKKNNIGYLLREGFRGVFLHGFMSFAAVCVTVACLIIMGTFSLVLYNVHVMIVDLEKENQVLVYIDEDYSEAEAKSVGSRINLISNVHEAKFVSREQALDNFVGKQSDTTAFNGVDASILRDRYEVTVEDNSLLEQTVAEIEKIDGVAEVNAYYEIANGFQSLQKVLNIASMVIIIVLFVVSLFIISNTVKLAMYSRSEEIAIMKMVGATNCRSWSRALFLACWAQSSHSSSNGGCTTSFRRRSRPSIRSDCSRSFRSRRSLSLWPSPMR